MQSKDFTHSKIRKSSTCRKAWQKYFRTWASYSPAVARSKKSSRITSKVSTSWVHSGCGGNLVGWVEIEVIFMINWKGSRFNFFRRRQQPQKTQRSSIRYPQQVDGNQPEPQRVHQRRLHDCSKARRDAPRRQWKLWIWRNLKNFPNCFELESYKMLSAKPERQ